MAPSGYGPSCEVASRPASFTMTGTLGGTEKSMKKMALLTLLAQLLWTLCRVSNKCFYMLTTFRGLLKTPWGLTQLQILHLCANLLWCVLLTSFVRFWFMRNFCGPQKTHQARTRYIFNCITGSSLVFLKHLVEDQSCNRISKTSGTYFQIRKHK